MMLPFRNIGPRSLPTDGSIRRNQSFDESGTPIAATNVYVSSIFSRTASEQERMAEVLEINDGEELETLRLSWAALLNDTPQASFFQTLDWLQAYWKHFGLRQRLRTLLVYSRGRPIGILPLVIRRERTRVGKLAVLTYPLHDWGNLFGPIGPNPTATLVAGLRHIRDTEQHWDLFDLRCVNAAEGGRGRTETAMQVGNLQAREQAWKTTCIVDLPETWERYLQDRDCKLVRELLRTERQLASAGEVTFERHRPRGAACGDVDPRWDLFSQCIDIATRTRRQTSANSKEHESAWAFLRTAQQAAAKRGALDVCLLKLDSQPIAYAYNYLHHGRVERLLTGAHPAFLSLGAEMLLTRLLIQDSIARGDTSLDLGDERACGAGLWATRTLNSVRYTHYAPTSARAQLLRAAHWWDARRLSG